MACPRPIEGSAGSRVKLALGSSGSDYILILNEDRGEREVQTILGEFEAGISVDLSKRIKECNSDDFFVRDFASSTEGEWYLEVRKKGKSTDDDDDNGEREQRVFWSAQPKLSAEIKKKYNEDTNLKVALGDGERWVLISSKNGFHFSGNLDVNGVNLVQRLRHVNEVNGTIRFVRLLPNGGYFVSDSEGIEAKGLPSDLAEVIEKKKSEDPIVDIATTKEGEWVVLFEKTFSYSENISKTLSTQLKSFYDSHKRNVENREKLIRIYNEEKARVIREYKAQSHP